MKMVLVHIIHLAEDGEDDVNEIYVAEDGEDGVNVIHLAEDGEAGVNVIHLADGKDCVYVIHLAEDGEAGVNVIHENGDGGNGANVIHLAAHDLAKLDLWYAAGVRRVKSPADMAIANDKDDDDDSGDGDGGQDDGDHGDEVLLKDRQENRLIRISLTLARDIDDVFDERVVDDVDDHSYGDNHLLEDS